MLATAGAPPVTASDLESAFGAALPASCVDKALQLCRLYGVDAEQLLVKWDAYALSKSGKDGDLSVLTPALLDELKRVLQKDAEKSMSSQYGVEGSYVSRRPQHEQPSYTADTLADLFDAPQTPRNQGPGQRRPKITPINASNKASGGAGSSAAGAAGGVFATPSRPASAYTPARTGPSPGQYGAFSTYGAGATGTPKTPATPGTGPTLTTPSPAIKFSDRPNRGKKEEILNQHVPLVLSSTSDARRPPVQVYLNADPPQPGTTGFRYMFEKLSAYGEHLDDQIEHFASQFLAANPHIDGLAHPGLPYQDPVTTVGRICKDASDSSSPVLFLEPSRAIGNGIRIPLDLSPLLGVTGPGFSLFPGQLVALTGTNPTGALLTVTELHQLSPPPNAATRIPDLRKLYPDDSLPLNLMFAAGPFTTDDSLAYEALEELCAVATKEKPEVVILAGPFVDAGHPLIKSGDLDSTMEEIFRTQIAKRLNTLLNNLPAHSKLLIVPSLNDALSPYLCLPQPPLPAQLTESESAMRARELALDPRIICLPNPAQVTINELVVAITSVDILFALSSDEVHRVPQGAAQGERMVRLTNHLINSASLYPLFPPAPSDPVLPSHADNLRMPVRPDLILLPGQLRHFAKDISGCVAVNPGRLCRKQAAGTWARMTVWPLKVGDAPIKEEGMDEEEEESVDHGLGGRCRVEIVRI